MYCVKQEFKMLAVFSLIIVVDTKITFVYNFVAPLKLVFSKYGVPKLEKYIILLI